MYFVLAAILVLSSAAIDVQTKPASRDLEIVHIDGKKNPEMIPEWSAWEEALTALAGRTGLLPDVLAPHFSKAERTLLLMEAEAHVKRERGYHERVKRLLAAKETKERIRDRNHEITLDYRWEILRGRDRVLAGLNPAAQAELRRFVEWMKQGTTVTILRKDLAFFLQPQ
jgi:hypothetical protein